MTSKVVPRNDRRSRKRSKRPEIPRVVKPPKIRVLIAGETGWGGRRTDSQLVIRRGCYRYMRWRAGRKMKEFYLGKVEKRTTQLRAAALAGAGGRGARLRGTKSKFQTFKCPYCPEIYMDQAALRNHVIDDHSDDLD